MPLTNAATAPAGGGPLGPGDAAQPRSAGAAVELARAHGVRALAPPGGPRAAQAAACAPLACGPCCSPQPCAPGALAHAGGGAAGGAAGGACSAEQGGCGGAGAGRGASGLVWLPATPAAVALRLAALDAALAYRPGTRPAREVLSVRSRPGQSQGGVL
jgi:hypothetical protein